MNTQNINSTNCSEVIDLLIGQMETENFDKHQLNQLVQQHPDCATELMANYQLWDDLAAMKTPEPRAEMSRDFYQKLNEYSSQNTSTALKRNSIWNWLKNWNLSANPQLGWALGIGLFLFGFFSGQNFNSNGQQEQINILAEKVIELEQGKSTNNRYQVNLQQSVAGRMKDIQLVRKMDNPTAKILEALNKALCNDPNINVRLSAIESLVYFSYEPAVMEILIKSIPQQTSPIVQLELAEVMVQLEEKRSSKAWKELLESGDLELNVKMQLEESLEVLL